MSATTTPHDDMTPHARDKYAPLPYDERPFGTALCLSGGGFRAALFHLGAARRLNELGVLSQIDTFVSVSGGSILAAFLGTHVRAWPASGEVIPDWDASIAEPFREFVRHNLRTWPLVKGYLLPWHWGKPGTAVSELAEGYTARLTDQRLRDLPERPRFLLCSTDLVSGRPIVFSCRPAAATPRDTGLATLYVADADPLTLRVPGAWPLGRAVAMSSAFPPVFDAAALPVRRVDTWQPGAMAIQDAVATLLGGQRAGQLRLTDGGVYDNMGLEPVWRDHRAILVSNGGATFDTERDRGWLWRLGRYPSIQGEQVTAVRKRWLIARYSTKDPAFALDGTYWGIESDPANYDKAAPGYGERLIDDIISEVRTDMDAFTDPEIAILENHGYLLADAALHQHAPTMMTRRDATLNVPHSTWDPRQFTPDELSARVRSTLKNSHRRWGLLGRFNTPMR